MIGGLENPLHIAFLVMILFVVFGARRLPEMGRSLGTGMREFKQSIAGELPGVGSDEAKGGSQQEQASRAARVDGSV